MKIGLERDNDAEIRLQIQPEDANLFARKSKFLDDWRKLPGPKYHETGDRISDSLQSNRDYDSIVEKYKKIPEIFYTKTKLPVVTPDNFREWLSLVCQHSLEFQEVFSGSGNLSFHFLSHGASVAFPVDFRYGWNARLDKHRKMLDELIVGTSFYAPNCTAWSSLSNWMPEETRDDLRKLEGPVLEWITTRSVNMWEQHSSATIVENPRNSTIWTKSPLLQLDKHPRAGRRPFDQCAYGLIEPSTGLAAQKPTSLLYLGHPLSTIFEFKSCPKNHKHVELLNHKAAAVYPDIFCSSLASALSSTSEFTAWSCKKCKYGSKCTEPHTKKRGCKEFAKASRVPPGGVPRGGVPDAVAPEGISTPPGTDSLPEPVPPPPDPHPVPGLADLNPTPNQLS